MSNIPIPTAIQQALVEGKNIFDNAWFMWFQDVYKNIRSALSLKLGGVLGNINTTASSAGGAATDLIVYSLDKNTIKNDKDYIQILVSGTYAANANNKQIQFKFGSQTIFDTTALPINDGSWVFEASISRTSSSTQDIFVKAFYNDLANTQYTAGTQDFLTSFDIKCIGTGISDGDIAQKLLIVELTPFN